MENVDFDKHQGYYDPRKSSWARLDVLEFKASTAKVKAAFETICAFLNGKGGTVLIGVKDNGQVIGQDVSDNTRREIANEIKKIEPTAMIDVHYVEVKEKRYVIILQVNRGDHAPYVYNGRAFQRNESQTNRMSQHCYEQLLVRRGQLNHSWEDALATGYTQCWLKMARFRGTDKLGEFMDNQQIHCNVFRMLEEADNFLRKHLPIASYFIQVIFP